MMTFNLINWNPFLVIFVLPLVAGVGLFIFASRLNIEAARIASRITGMQKPLPPEIACQALQM